MRFFDVSRTRRYVGSERMSIWGERNPMKLLCRVVFAFCLLAFIAKPALSQDANTGEIRGTVTDKSGAVIPGATVSVTNRDTGVKNDFTSNNAGIYDTVSTPTGNYDISF